MLTNTPAQQANGVARDCGKVKLAPLGLTQEEEKWCPFP